ncbi:hypothetical protein niasHS_013381 [Heterodera schachtii]|uniref:F-box domain-containing protein n=1 Tax=Heterodera schachtii TaxID=97005 RepID=A0ABD2IG47_HETSC
MRTRPCRAKTEVPTESATGQRQPSLILMPINKKNKMDKSPKQNVTTADDGNGHRNWRRLPNELLFELVLCVPSTKWPGRQLLLTSSLVYRIIAGSKKTQNWRKPLPIMAVDNTFFRHELTSFHRMFPLIPRWHSDASFFLSEFVPMFNQYMRLSTDEKTKVQSKSFAIVITIDQAQLPEGRTAEEAKNDLQIALHSHPTLANYCRFLYFRSGANSVADKMRLFFP